MSYIIPKTDIPQENYFPINLGEVVAMMTVTPTGPVIIYPDEVLYVPWKEIAEYAAGSAKSPLPSQQPEMATAHPDPKKPNVREIKK